MTQHTESEAGRGPFVFPWERTVADLITPDAVHVIRGTRAQRVGLIVSGAVSLVCASLFITSIVSGSEGVLGTVGALSILVLMVAGIYLVNVAQIFVQPSIAVLRDDEVITASVFGTRRRPLDAMIAVHRHDIRPRLIGLRSSSKRMVYRLFFEEDRPVTLRVPQNDYDVRGFVRALTERWSTVRRAEVHRRLFAGQTVTIRKALSFVHRTTVIFYGSVSIGPNGVSISRFRGAIELGWDRIAQVQVADAEQQLTIHRTGGERPEIVDGLVAPAMLAANIADGLAIGFSRSSAS